MIPEPEHELVRRAAAGDAKALDALWLGQRRFVTACLLARAPRPEVDDLLQEVAMQLWTGIRQLRDPQRLRPWLRSVALNAARSQARKTAVRTRSVRSLEDHDTDLPDRPGSAGEAELHDRVQEVLRVVQRLPEDYREPLLLRAVEGLTQKQIAHALELPETTVETRLARARQMLRRRVVEEEGGTTPSRTAIRGVER